MGRRDTNGFATMMVIYPNIFLYFIQVLCVLAPFNKSDKNEKGAHHDQHAFAPGELWCLGYYLYL